MSTQPVPNEAVPAVPTKPPAFQWYPGDFRRDTALAACSFEARALWREMLDLMHDGTPRGHLTAGGVPITPDELARIVGVPTPKARRWLGELEDRRVFSRTAAGVIYSRRMVRDQYISTVRAAAGKQGGNPLLVKQTPSKPAANGEQTAEQKPTPASAVASSSSLQLQKEHPRRHRAASNGAAQNGASPSETWLTPAKLAWEAHNGAGSFPIKQAAGLLSPIHRAGIEPDEIGRRLGRYCTAKKGARYSNLADFAQHHGEYAVPSGPLVDSDGVLTELGERETRPARVLT